MIRNRRLLSLIGASVCLLGTVAQSHATVTVYNSLAAFQAASGSTALENFTTSGLTTYAPGTNFGPASYNGFSLSGATNGGNAGVTLTGFNATGSGNDTLIPASFLGQNYFGWGQGPGPGNTGATTKFSFAAPITAFAFDWFNTDTTDKDQVTLTLASGSTVFSSPPFGFTSNGFFGVVITGDTLASATISTAGFGGYICDRGFDNVRTSGGAPVAATVPDSGTTLALLGLALCVLGFARRLVVA